MELCVCFQIVRYLVKGVIISHRKVIDTFLLRCMFCLVLVLK